MLFVVLVISDICLQKKKQKCLKLTSRDRMCTNCVRVIHESWVIHTVKKRIANNTVYFDKDENINKTITAIVIHSDITLLERLLKKTI